MCASVAAVAATKEGVQNKKGTAVLSETLLGSVLVLAAIVTIFLIIRIVMCKSGTWTGGIC